MVTIANKESLNKLYPKIFMVKSKVDNRLGVIVKRYCEEDKIVIKMENIERPIIVNQKTLLEGFSFIFSKFAAISEWYFVKYKRGILPKLDTLEDVMYCQEEIYDMLCPCYPSLFLKNHEIFVILKKLREKFNKC